MHYLYTQFYISSTEGAPIMRPMWYEFPGDPEVFTLTSQFMWGDSILVAPKLKKALYKQHKYFFPRSEDDQDKWWSVDVYLPSRFEREFDTQWYSYTSKLKVLPDDLRDGWLFNLLLENLEFSLFVRSGSIIPIKLHKGAQALLRTMAMPLRLDVYLSGDGAYAEGLLYLDDGESFRYQTKNEKALIKYQYFKNKLVCQNVLNYSYKY